MRGGAKYEEPVAEVILFPNSGTQKEKDEWWVKSGNETRMTNLLTKLLENDQYKQTIIDINKQEDKILMMTLLPLMKTFSQILNGVKLNIFIKLI